MSNAGDILKTLAKQGSLETLEKRAKVGNATSSLFIGIPETNSYHEKRIPLTPKSVSVLVARGHRVWIETKAGESAGFLDNDYSEAGAKIVYDKKEIYNADVIIKMSPVNDTEITHFTRGQKILSPLQLPALKGTLLETLLEKQVVGMAFEYIKDEVKNFPIVHALSEVAGRAAVLIAGQLLSNGTDGKGMLLGGITGVKPSNVVILGSGTVGESAARAALGMGANVKIFDNNVYKLRRLQNNLGNRLYTSVINPDTLEEELRSADVVIGAIHSKTGRAPVVVTEHMVQCMPPKSVIIDVSMDQGGVIETSEVTTVEKPTFVKHDVIHYCVPNIPSIYSKTASMAISNILTPMLIDAGEAGGFESYLRIKKGLRKGVYVYKGKLTNEHLSERFHMKFTDLELLMATGFGS